MAWFWKTKKTASTDEAAARTPHDPRSIESTLKNDLLGVDDFKKSKIGFLTGISSANRVVKGVGESLGATNSRIKGIYSSLTRSEENVPSLATEDLGSDAHLRFVNSMKLHQLREADLIRILRNTTRMGWTYCAFTVLCLAVAVLSYLVWPPTGGFSAIFRLGPLPLFAALMFKSFFTNWMVRHRVLTGPGAYFRSGDWFPRSSF